MSNHDYNSKESAFPTSSLITGGLTKLEYMALEIQKALIQGYATEIMLKRTDATFAEHAVRLADDLLKKIEAFNYPEDGA